MLLNSATSYISAYQSAFRYYVDIMAVSLCGSSR